MKKSLSAVTELFTQRVGLFLGLLPILVSCINKVDPQVSTQYIKEGSRQEQRAVAFNTLLSHYRAGNKEKQFFEVISKKDGRFILNYNRIDQRLTLCLDPGSGWGSQYVNIAEDDLEEFVSKSFTLTDFEGGNATWVDSVTIIMKGKELKYATTKERIRPKTNGKPSGY